MTSGLISRSSALKAIADTYDIDDTTAELAQTSADRDNT
jgi:hypothetical protein